MSASVRRFTYALAAVALGATGLVLAPDCRWPTEAWIASVVLMGAGLLRLNDWCEEEE